MTQAPPQIGLLELLQTASGDVASTVAFYRDVLGAAVQTESPRWARLRLGNIDIGVHAAGGTVPYEGWMPAFRVADVRAVRAAVMAAGLESRDYHDIPGGVTLQFRDPAGNWLAAIEYGTSEERLAALEA
jgi:predicted enzyme related to lactoylglutathione lyase